MRLIPILTAVVVTVALYFGVFERDRLRAFAGRGVADAVPAEAEGDTVVEAEAEEAQENTGERRVSVIAVRSTAQEINSAVLIRGQTEAARQIDVRSETSGLVNSEPLRKGTFVEQGQLLCEIEAGTRETALAEAKARLGEAEAKVPEAEARVPEAQSRVLEAQARLEEALINDRAAQSLSKDGFASGTRVASTNASVSSARATLQAAESGVKAASSTVESAIAAVTAARAGVAAAEKEIERLAIHAPFSGLLESDTAELGSLLQPGGSCATVIQLDPIKLVGFVPETEVDKVRLGARAGARLATGHEVAGEVTFLSRSADASTRTFRVEVAVENNDLSIRDGQTVEIAVASDGAEAHLVPQSALTLDNSGRIGVRFVESGDVAGFAPITVLRDSQEGVWVGGLPKEITIVTVGQEYIIDGVPLDVTLVPRAGDLSAAPEAGE
ncbi:efflux RND transporter periplasmic adaptor subunit [Alphaproteobacteria bacterium KMM 3653]|uniref:Efflux RND transporter periplasmic adaptor subunit n=1 Tax=Harenicola maris TaxID=2841044 RepID=A0AAP2G3T2_9RHOB|nr:efflux RND transporter periplasmic adaptor subunit [Harenicola maris]